jgi:peptidoglycan glycosyltransferase
MPSYDPNPLASHDEKTFQAEFKKLNGDDDKPLLNRAIADTKPPGSTFKVLIAAAALQNGRTPDSVIQAGASYTAPGTTVPIRNSGDQVCPASRITLKQALTTSCNTGFARLGVDLGADTVKKTAQAFGFAQTGLTVGNLTGGGLPVAASDTGAMSDGNGGIDRAALAQSAIGQRDVRMTVLQGAMIAATVANDGKQMRPYLVQQLLDSERRPVRNASPEVLRTPINAQVAGDLREMMISVVENGTGRRAKISGFEVGGKTGTAQNAENKPPHGWFIGFAFNEKGEAVSASCVMLENVEGGHASAVAAEISGKIMRAAADRGGD